MKCKDWIVLSVSTGMFLLVSVFFGWEISIGRIDFTLSKAIKIAIALLLFVDLFAMGAVGYIYFRAFVKKKIKAIEEVTEEEKVTLEPIGSDNEKKKEQEQKN